MMAQTRAATDTLILQTPLFSIFGRQANETYSLHSGTGWSRGEKPCYVATRIETCLYASYSDKADRGTAYRAF